MNQEEDMKASNSELIVKKVEIFITGDEHQERPRWASYLEDIFTTNTIVKITTEDGYEGIGGVITYTENQFDLSLGETICLYMPKLLGQSLLNSQAVWNLLAKRPTIIARPALSAIDIALWDLRAKYARMPLYQMLGGTRDRILSYASSPLLDSNSAYLTFIEKCLEEGFKAVKIHPYTTFKEDYELVQLIQAKFGDSDVRFNFDPDEQYSREEAFKMAKLLEAYDWDWFEAPLPDSDLEGYRVLREKSSVPILPGGNHYLSATDIQHGIEAKAWTSARVDTTFCGGITEAKKIIALAEANQMKVELQSWGMTLTQAANLHMMLSTASTTYFEQAFPYEPFEVGAKTVIRTDKDGYVTAPKGNGLGIELDWEVIEKITLKHYIFD